MSVATWDQRQLCPDGGCVGVIGDDGLCKVCGRAALNWGDERKRGLVAEPEPEPPAEAPRVEAAPPDDDVHDYEWGRRRLCNDGACVGVIGADGKCKVCGK